MAFARYKGEAENVLLSAGFSRVYIFRPAYIYPVEPRKEPNFSYRALRAIYPLFKTFFPNQVIRADDLGRAMIDVLFVDSEHGPIFENSEIRAMVESLHPHPSVRPTATDKCVEFAGSLFDNISLKRRTLVRSNNQLW